MEIKRESLNGNSHPLQNNGELELFFLGTGSAFATTKFQTNFLIIKGGAHVLVDFGMSGPMALAHVAKLKATDIRCILPTHSHGDHVNGIECLALMNRYVGRKFMNHPKIKMIINEEYERILWDYTLRGALEYNEEEKATKKRLSLVDYFDLVRPTWKTHQPREIFSLWYDGIKIEIFRTKHIPDNADTWEASFISYGLFIDDKILISGDTRFDLDLLSHYGDRAEHIIHDVQFFPGGVHANLPELNTLPHSLKKNMMLVHYPDDYETHNEEIKDFAGWVEQGVRYLFI